MYFYTESQIKYSGAYKKNVIFKFLANISWNKQKYPDHWTFIYCQHIGLRHQTWFAKYSLNALSREAAQISSVSLNPVSLKKIDGDNKGSIVPAVLLWSFLKNRWGRSYKPKSHYSTFHSTEIHFPTSVLINLKLIIP